MYTARNAPALEMQRRLAARQMRDWMVATNAGAPEPGEPGEFGAVTVGPRTVAYDGRCLVQHEANVIERSMGGDAEAEGAAVVLCPYDLDPAVANETEVELTYRGAWRAGRVVSVKPTDVSVKLLVRWL